MIFGHRKLTLKVKFWHFLTACHLSKTQNSIISFRCVDSYPKIFPILYPPLENSTTRTAMIYIGLPKKKLKFHNIAFFCFDMQITQIMMIVTSFEKHFFFTFIVKFIKNVSTILSLYSFCFIFSFFLNRN